MSKQKYIIILFIFCIAAILPSKSSSTVFSDTLETPAYSDTTEIIDTLATKLLYPKRITPIQNIGVLAPTLPTYTKLDDSRRIESSTTIRHSNYRHLGNLLESFAGVFLYNFSSFGQPHTLLSNYTDYRTIVLAHNGISLNDPITGFYNLNYFPTENIERIEFINSTKAFLYTFNSTGSLVNMVSKFYNNNTPYTRLRYSESAYEETYLDGMFSQNILHNFNLTGGVQRIVADGRYANSEYNSWNVRLKLRHNISDNLNVYFNEIYNQNILGLNGGVDLVNTPTKDIFDEMRAVVKYSDAYEKVARNDLQLGAAGRFLPDTSSITQLIFFLSNQMRLFRDLQPPSAFQPIRESYHT
ncbi:MAG: TonB-dependent receptor plug domain-containing protein, partial [Bacteroidota bacterium]|nr:TonB-dependent receptor plug domain-containing protein [Bacteroidota bacterium]